MSENQLFILPCHKTKNHQQAYEFGKAIVYLKLRNSGCSQKTSLDFAKKRYCRADITQKHLGPSGHRVLNLQVNSLQKNSIQEGWLLNLDPEYKMGGKYVMNLKSILRSDEQDEKLARDMDK